MIFGLMSRVNRLIRGFAFLGALSLGLIMAGDFHSREAMMPVMIGTRRLAFWC